MYSLVKVVKPGDLHCWSGRYCSYGSNSTTSKWQLNKFFRICGLCAFLDLIVQFICVYSLRAWTECSAKKRFENQRGNISSAQSDRIQNQWPIASSILWKELPIAASATNPHWHMQPLTVVYGESASPDWMLRITVAWHSLWINCASWHAQLTVSNSACDLCTAASNILLDQSHRFTVRLEDCVCYHLHRML